eukprot:GFUD01027724.1.p1 GENE.GFUD01027724.1~~GFUD01027724.1.p1  ORF type:complete len:402 (+),score=56.53 GFUD01027724.1:362-1567(+)
MENTKGIERSLILLVIIQFVGAFLSLLAGASLVAHVEPLSECVLFGAEEGESLSYGDPHYCEFIGYGFIILNVVVIVTAYLTLKQRSNISSLSKHFSMRNLKSLKIGKRLIVLHGVIFFIVLMLTVFLTVGYKSSCDNFENHVTKLLDIKLNQDPNLLRGETIEERFVEDPMFWRYAQQVTNVFGSSVYTIKASCRALFTDPDIATLLHDTHVTKYSGYYGWWDHLDIYPYEAQAQAVRTNVLIEASLAGAWMGTFVWLGATIFILLQKKRISKQTSLSKADAVDTMSTRSDRSGSTVQRGSLRPGQSPASSLRLGGNVYASVTSNASSYNRKEMDDLALGSILDPNFYKNNKNNNNVKLGKANRRRSGSFGHLQMQIQTQPLLLNNKPNMAREHYETEIM